MTLINHVWTPLIGGLCIGTAAAVLWWFNGRILGVSGILGNLLRGLNGAASADRGWQLAFLIGLLLAPWLYRLVATLPPITVQPSVMLYVVAGVLVGFGTRLGSGCTSGHGICGNARLSVRSMIATLMFMLAGMMTVWLIRHGMAA